MGHSVHAFDAVYHQLCSINFRRGKTIPQIFTGEPRGSVQETKGREAREACEARGFCKGSRVS